MCGKNDLILKMPYETRSTDDGVRRLIVMFNNDFCPVDDFVDGMMHAKSDGSDRRILNIFVLF